MVTEVHVSFITKGGGGGMETWKASRNKKDGGIGKEAEVVSFMSGGWWKRRGALCIEMRQVR